MASVGWIYFSQTHRNRIGTVLDMLEPEGMVDELGLGTLRDGIANELFPGVSTIQTRAKYLFIIPYILYDYQKLKPAQRRGKTASRYLDEREHEIMWELAERYNHKDGSGVIGITKFKPQKIARRPSAIYWNALATWHFMDTRGLPAESFLKQASNPSVSSLLESALSGDEPELLDDRDADFDNMFRIKVPPKLNWAVDVTLDLSNDEAELLRDRIQSLAHDKLIGELLVNDRLWDCYASASSFMDFARLAVKLPMPTNLKELLVLSHDFSMAMYGVHLAYNCQLQRKAFGNHYYEKEWKQWLRKLPDNMIDYRHFNPDHVFDIAPSNRRATDQFIAGWWHEVEQGFDNIKKRDVLILQQEATVKGTKARLQWNKFDDVGEKRWMGLEFFDYRFKQVKTIITDIKEGLR